MASCRNVMHGFYTGRKTATGGMEVIRVNRKIKELEWEHPIYKEDGNLDHYKKVTLTDYFEIPCGVCEICKAKQASQKAQRATAEAASWENNIVINLTYNDENLPIGEKGRPTLRYKDLQDFKKRLLENWERKYNKKGIRFMVACEYGEKKLRPHYHLILFNTDIPDKYEWGYSKKGSKQYRSSEIEKIWNKGNITIGDVTPETIQYVANYCLKKFKGKEAKGYYKELGIEPERVVSSNKRGLGAEFFDKHKEVYKEHGKCLVGTLNGLETVQANRYFDLLMAKEWDEETVRRAKEKRKILAEQREMTRAYITGVDIETLRKNDENEFLEKIKKAKQRDFVSYG